MEVLLLKMYSLALFEPITHLLTLFINSLDYYILCYLTKWATVIQYLYALKIHANQILGILHLVYIFIEICIQISIFHILPF